MTEERNITELKYRKRKKFIDEPSISEGRNIAQSTMTEDKFQ